MLDNLFIKLMQARCNQQSLFGQPVYCFPDLSYFDGVGALAGLKIEREEFWNQFDERHAIIDVGGWWRI